MSKQAYQDFKKTWLDIYIKQYKTSDKKAQREIKENLYKNIKLTNIEKDKLWEQIMMFVK